jgi:GAF domain-containing protein/anti-sigma regulatory factor (Ser/Thr protein kinase)
VARAAKGLEEEVEAGVRIPLGAGFAGRVVAERRPIFLPDVSPKSVVNPILIEKGLRSMLGVPLLVEGRALGVLHVGSLVPREFSDSDAELLQLAADRIAIAIDHARLFQAERDAREEAERAIDRMRKLESITDVALGQFSLEQGLMEGLLDRVRTALGVDTAAILLTDSEGRELVARAAKGLEEEVEAGVRIPVGRGFAGRIASERRPVYLPDIDRADVLNPILREKGIHSMLGVPLLVEQRVTGVLHVGSLTPREFSDDEVALLELAADRIAIAIDRASQHGIAATLQRTLLPARLPEIPGVTMAARYLPSADDAHVGGDWYDVLRLPHGRVGIVMGDVVSRGVPAAAAMGQLRTALRAYALAGERPGVVLERLENLLSTVDDREMATIAYLVLDPATHTLQYALAGHPPPLALSPAGEARFLEGGRSGPVGVLKGARHADADDAIESGETLVLYTDGLVERRDEPIEDGLQRLRAAVEAGPPGADELCEHLVWELGTPVDDVAVLVARLSSAPDERLEARVTAAPDALAAMRRSLTTWLVSAGASEDDAYDMVLAVGEAAANAVEHAYGPGDAEFDLGAEVTDGAAVIEIRDSGRWREARGRHRGRGLDLMRELMDDVEVEQSETGTTVRLRRKLRREGST